MDNQDQNINNQLPQSPVADGNQPSNPTQRIAVQVIKPILPTVDNEASGAQPMPITSDSIYPEGQVDLDISPDPQVDPSSKSPSLQQAGNEILKEQKKEDPAKQLPTVLPANIRLVCSMTSITKISFCIISACHGGHGYL